MIEETAVQNHLDRPDMFDCQTYVARIPARTCIARQAKAKKDEQLAGACVGCVQGQKILQKFGKHYENPQVSTSTIHNVKRTVVMVENKKKDNLGWVLTEEQKIRRKENSTKAIQAMNQLYAEYKRLGFNQVESAVRAMRMGYLKQLEQGE